ncbi:MAG: nitroreductase family protein [Spongiibacter sp.]|uniref:Putative NAD(P)H nitroreductase n=1 Tax=Spongiibacter thalassae TaxID=2721624 RepID=A0ABX1GF22_9GAMM|nr:nitroreductase family protein [Spongiibacter thalassae]MDX1504460.1 nitroreductase family protein [Spongiibacter sp.]NKI16809.1 nitroreductase [Spongiibacter thalassae]
MDALALLQQRNSASKLCEPAPTAAELTEIFTAANRAPDHARLRPWRFRVVEGQARARLGEVFVQAALKRNSNIGEAELDKYRRQPLRAPMLMVVSAVIQEHPKVPAVEQRLSAGCAAFAALLALEAMGYAGIWRTGGHAFDRNVMDGIGLLANEEIIGFLYIGTRDGLPKPLPEISPAEFVETWTGL